MAYLLKVKIHDKGKLIGRVLSETIPRGILPKWKAISLTSLPDRFGNQTVVQMQTIGRNRYFDAAGYPGRTLGLMTHEERHRPKD